MDRRDLGDRNRTIVVDWDGTLVENKWPDMGDWMPGAVEAMKALHEAGFMLQVYSCRLSPYTPSYQERDPAEVYTDVMAVRDKLDSVGLHFVDIFTKAGKPTAFLYIDDKGERYGGRTGSWAKMVQKVLIRAEQEG